MYARLDENNKVVEFPIFNIRERFPQTSFPEPMNDLCLPDRYVRVHNSTPPPYDWATQSLSQVDPTFDGEKWVETFVVVDLSTEETTERQNAKASAVRELRNTLLQECDWTQGKDIPDSVSTIWASYRQALRDIPEQTGFPFDVTFPTKPE